MGIFFTAGEVKDRPGVYQRYINGDSGNARRWKWNSSGRI